jgi:uncharacterized membrane protein
MNPLIQCKTTILLLLVASVLACFALVPKTKAVVPAPDGGYLNGNTAEGQNDEHQYRFQAFDVPPELGEGTTAQGINNRGIIVGNFVRVDGSFDGFLSENGHFTDVVVPGASPDLAGPLGGINDLGMAVGGFIEATTGIGHAFLLTPRGEIRIQPDPAPDAVLTEALGINNKGTIVGFYFDLNDIQHGFILRRGVSETYDYPGASQTALTAINDRNQIVGFWIDAAFQFHGFMLQDGVMTNIEPPGSTTTAPRGINNRGQIVGGFRDAANVGHGFLLSRGIYTSLDFPGAFHTTAIGINDRGMIVGTYNFFTRGFIATRD